MADAMSTEPWTKRLRLDRRGVLAYTNYNYPGYQIRTKCRSNVYPRRVRITTASVSY